MGKQVDSALALLICHIYPRFTKDLSSVHIIYTDDKCLYEQPLSNLPDDGNTYRPETGDDMEIIGYKLCSLSRPTTLFPSVDLRIYLTVVRPITFYTCIQFFFIQIERRAHMPISSITSTEATKFSTAVKYQGAHH